MTILRSFAALAPLLVILTALITGPALSQHNTQRMVSGKSGALGAQMPRDDRSARHAQDLRGEREDRAEAALPAGR